MRILRSLPVLFASLLLAACGGSGNVVNDPGAGAGSSASMPTEVPPADGAVRTRTLVTVMDTGRPELCLGPVAESYPPQCSGLPLVDWKWSDHNGVFEKQGKTRWGLFSVTGSFDGTSFSVTDAIPAALFDAMVEPEPEAPAGTDTDQATLTRIQRELEELPGLLTSAGYDGYLAVEVVHDDGSLQAWADETYGEGVVVITSSLVSAG